MNVLRITHYTDPYCPWAFSAEPHRRAAMWRHGDALRWHTRMVVLSESPQDYLSRGFGPEQLAPALAAIAAAHGMPIDASVRTRMAATVVACRAVVAARRIAGAAAADRLLRALRVAALVDARLIDTAEVVADAARSAGLDPDALAAATADPATEVELRDDMAAARRPSREALAMDHKLAGPATERRYTCPSWEVERADDGRRLSLPGFQPWAVYEVALANLAPELEDRPAPEDPREVLRWAGEPLAAMEVAAVMGVDRSAAETALAAAGAAESRGLWSL